MVEILKNYSSPNFNERIEEVDTLVLHYTDMTTAEAAIERLCDIKSEVSAHYLIAENSAIYQLVDPYKRAWHAGLSKWRGREKVNDFSIGIEIANPGHSCGYIHFPTEQMNSVIILAKQLIKQFNIKNENIVGHSDIAPSRKKDPGELFDWKILADNKIGYYHNLPQIAGKILYNPGDNNMDILQIQKKLLQIGYFIEPTGMFDQLTTDVIIAYKRRFHQLNVDDNWDELCHASLEQLLKLYPEL
jgi:N-acetylmuramoyl-L-alanine amidase